MVAALEPIWQQFEETDRALRFALEKIPQNKLLWSPGGEAMTVTRLVLHTAVANIIYVAVMEGTQNGPRWEFPTAPTHALLTERLGQTRERVREVFEAMTEESLTQPRADDWNPLDDDCVVEGPLDALWFALQVVRHTAYHLGQLNAYRLVLAARE